MPEAAVCVMSFFIPCSMFTCCSFCVMFCWDCCKMSNNSNTRSPPGEGGGVITQQPTAYDSLKRRMVAKFRNTWLSVSKRNKSPPNPATQLEPPKTETTKVDSKETCCICFDGYDKEQPEQLLGVVKKCQHHFHFDCLWTWLASKNSCPLCRESAQLSEEDITGIPLKFVLIERSTSRENTLQKDGSEKDSDQSDRTDNDRNSDNDLDKVKVIASTSEQGPAKPGGEKMERKGVDRNGPETSPYEPGGVENIASPQINMC